MGIVKLEDNQEAEIEEFRRMILSCAAVQRRKDEDDGIEDRGKGLFRRSEENEVFGRLVCVTSGVSYLGIAIVNQLLRDGYSVRIIVDNEEDVENLRDLETSGEMRLSNNTIEVVTANLDNVESLKDAFNGCCCVFHTAAFVDPSGLSGYTKSMAEIEVNVSENVIKACGISPSVSNCVLTSSLLTCIWQDVSDVESHPVLIDHRCWSNESVCINKKLWYALGKLKAEKTAWEVSRQCHLRLATICPGLITGTRFYQRNPTATVAYLKGLEEMYGNGLLATVDIKRLAHTHVRVFQETMKTSTACGRYICFDKVVNDRDEVLKLVQKTGLNRSIITDLSPSCNDMTPFVLSNIKLAKLMSRRCKE